MAEGEITIEVDQAALNALDEQLSGISHGVGRAVAWAANRTATHVKAVISTRIRNRIPIKKKDVDRYITIKRARSGDQSPEATVTLSKSKRIPLGYFGAVQVGNEHYGKIGELKRAQKAFGNTVGLGGVRYKIGKGFARGGFMGPRPGVIATKLRGQAYIRPNNGPRMPIKILKGPSAWGVFVLSGAMPVTLRQTADEMNKNLAQAVNYLLLQKARAI